MKLLSRAEVAEQLGVHVDTVKRLEKRGALTAIRVGRAVRYESRAVESFVQRQKLGLDSPGITPPNSRQRGAFNAKATELGKHRGLTKREIKVEAYTYVSRIFDRSISTWDDLETYDEASTLLDWLEDAIDQFEVAVAAANVVQLKAVPE